MLFTNEVVEAGWRIFSRFYGEIHENTENIPALLKPRKRHHPRAFLLSSMNSPLKYKQMLPDQFHDPVREKRFLCGPL